MHLCYMLKVVGALQKVVSELKTTQGLLNSQSLVMSALMNALSFMPSMPATLIKDQISTIQSTLASIKVGIVNTVGSLVNIQASITDSIARYDRFIQGPAKPFCSTVLQTMIRLEGQVQPRIDGISSGFESTSLPYWNIAIKV